MYPPINPSIHLFIYLSISVHIYTHTGTHTLHTQTHIYIYIVDQNRSGARAHEELLADWAPRNGDSVGVDL